jgi:hypothetical protein
MANERSVNTVSGRTDPPSLKKYQTQGMSPLGMYEILSKTEMITGSMESDMSLF